MIVSIEHSKTHSKYNYNKYIQQYIHYSLAISTLGRLIFNYSFTLDYILFYSAYTKSYSRLNLVNTLYIAKDKAKNRKYSLFPLSSLLTYNFAFVVSYRNQSMTN